MQATDRMRSEVGKVLEADDIAAAILFAVAQSEHVPVSEVIVVARGQRG